MAKPSRNHNKTKNTMNSGTRNAAVDQLEKQGYVVVLHHVDDVKDNYYCNDEEARDVLITAIETHLDNIEDSIHVVAEDMELPEIDYIYSELLDVFIKLYKRQTGREVEHDLGVTKSVNIYRDSTSEIWVTHDEFGLIVNYHNENSTVIGEKRYQLKNNNFIELIDQIYNELPEVAK